MSLEEISKLELEAEELNNPELWKKVLIEAEKLYKENSEKLEIVLRLGFLYWILILENGVYIHDLDLEKLESSLKKLYRNSKYKFSNSAEYLWIFSYMMGITPYYFDEEEKEAERMYLNALKLDPNNPFVYLTKSRRSKEYISSKKYKEMCEKVRELIENKGYFYNRGLLGSYFKDVIDY